MSTPSRRTSLTLETFAFFLLLPGSPITLYFIVHSATSSWTSWKGHTAKKEILYKHARHLVIRAGYLVKQQKEHTGPGV